MNEPDLSSRDVNEGFSFDVVIVGAGAGAMGLVSGLLRRSKSADLSVAIIERGSGPPHDASTKYLCDFPDAALLPSKSCTPYPAIALGNRMIDVATGKGIGGTTNINAGMVIPPAPEDMDRFPWPEKFKESLQTVQAQMKDAGCLATHMTSVDDMRSSLLLHSTRESSSSSDRSSCPVLTPNQSSQGTLFPSMLLEARYSGVRENETSNRVIRKNYFTSLVLPWLEKDQDVSSSKFHWFRSVRVDRILIENQRAVGVKCQSETHRRIITIRAKHEVIVCAGAIGSPLLLLSSGIGERNDLEEAEIDPYHVDAPSLPVGHNLMDHVFVPRGIMSSWRNFTLSPSTVQALVQCSNHTTQIVICDSTAVIRMAATLLATLLFRNKLSSSSRWRPRLVRRVVQFLCSVSYTCTRLSLVIVLGWTPLYFVLMHCSFYANLILLRPKSKGKISLVRCRRRDGGGNNNLEVKIALNYLSNDKDILSLWECYLESKQILKSYLRGKLDNIPGVAFEFLVPIISSWTPSKAAKQEQQQTTNIEEDVPTWFKVYCKTVAVSFYHYFGTCVMKGNIDDDKWVVDHEFRVRGLQGLRICDASVISQVSTPTALTCAALGDVCSSLLVRDAAGSSSSSSDKKKRL